uniref:E3 ubiquitin-protein ligase n=1 Tax=Gongylonema pulchrum TaxID=637853 RepID=A0A183E6X5_9BILA
LMYGAQQQGTDDDVKFAKHQWTQLTFGFRQNEIPSKDASEADRDDYTQQSSVSESSSTLGPIAKMRVAQDSDVETGIPVVMYDLKTTLIRISAYVLTNDSLTNEDKKGLLKFIYQIVLYASIVRTAVIAVFHLSPEQLPETKNLQLSSEVFTFATANVVERLFSSRPYQKPEDILCSGKTEVDFEKAFRYSCTDLARFTAQFWHECGMIVFDETYLIGHATFEETHKLLTGDDELSVAFLPAAHVEKWVDELFGKITTTSFVGILRSEPLGYRRFTLLELPHSYDDLFALYFGRDCFMCCQVPRMPFICLLCAVLCCLDNCCAMVVRGETADNEVERILRSEPLGYRRFTLLELPHSYDDLFALYFGRDCFMCCQVPRMPFICLLCAVLCCLDNCCAMVVRGETADNEVERHTMECGGGIGCFLSLTTSLIVIVCNHKAAFWGSVYLDSHGEEDRNLRRGKPLFLSERRLARLRSDWVMQSFDQLNLKFFSFENLITNLRDSHYILF